MDIVKIHQKYKDRSHKLQSLLMKLKSNTTKSRDWIDYFSNMNKFMIINGTS